MNNIKINTQELNQKIIELNSLIIELDTILDKFESKLKLLAYANHIWYSSTTIALYDHYNEHATQIKQLQDSYKHFFQSINDIIEEYENLEDDIIKKADNISFIHIV